MAGVAGGDRWREMAERTTILRGLVGSTVHGLQLAGTDDRDEMGVCIEDLDAVAGLGAPFEQYVYRTAAAREGRHDAKSSPGDLDLTVYSLRKFLRLALQGNPTILNLLFVPPTWCVVRDARGAQLQELAPKIASREAAGRFLGYLQAQRQRLLGERGQKDVRRPALEAAHGYDTKYAMHMLRLGVQGVEYLETGQLTLPIQEPARTGLLDVRMGKVPLQDVLTEVGEFEQRLKDLRDTSPLPSAPDRAGVEAWMLSVYFENWKARDRSWAVTHEG